jgi:hypothetical protein
MPTLTPLLLLFFIFMLVGGIRTFRLLAARRKGSSPAQALLRWSEKPLSSWRYEPYTAAAVLVHTLAICALSLATFSAAGKPATFSAPLFSNDRTMTILTWIAEGGSMALIGYLLGAALAFPVFSLRSTPIQMAITARGVVHGRTLLPWHWFSHFSIDQEGFLRLYSAFSPDLPSLISKPPTSALLAEVSKALQEYLPGGRADGNRAWYRTKFFLIPTMVLVCFPFVAATWFALRLPREMALFCIALLASALSIVGGGIISLFGFGVFRPKADALPNPRDA